MSFLVTFALLVVAPAAERGLDIVLLASFGAAAEQNDQHPAIPTEVDPIARTAVDPEFSGALADRLDVRRITLGETLDGEWSRRRRPAHQDHRTNVGKGFGRLRCIPQSGSYGTIYVTISQA